MKLVVFDLDRTLVTVNSSYLFSSYLYKRNILSLRDRLYCIQTYLAYIFFRNSLQELHTKVFERLFKGRALPLFEEEVKPFLDLYFHLIGYTPALSRLNQAKEEGHSILLLSSSPQILVAPIARRLGISLWESTYYLVDAHGCFSHIEQLMDGNEKVNCLKKHATHLNVSYKDISAYSDSYDDLPLLKAVGEPVGVNPDRKLKKACRIYGWEVI